MFSQLITDYQLIGVVKVALARPVRKNFPVTDAIHPVSCRRLAMSRF